MRSEYTVGFEDYKSAQRTYVRRSVLHRVLFYLQMWGLLVGGLALALAVGRLPSLRLVWGSSLAGIFGGLLGCGLLIPLMRSFNLRRGYRQLNSADGSPLRAYIGVEGDLLVSGVEGKSEARFQRSGICRVEEDETNMLLYVRKKIFLYLPKAKLPAEALDEIKEWLAKPGAPRSC